MKEALQNGLNNTVSNKTFMREILTLSIGNLEEPFLINRLYNMNLTNSSETKLRRRETKMKKVFLMLQNIKEYIIKTSNCKYSNSIS